MKRRPGDVRVGVSGWRYPPWRGVFYPPGLPQARELAFASRRLRTVEINGSFYSLQRPSSYRRWYAETPDGFVFAVKGGRFMTHHKKLRDCADPLANFFASGILALEEKLGPILRQLSPQLAFVLRVLRRAGVALCIADTAGRWPALDAVTARFVYVRLHGVTRLYVSGYDRAALDAWAARIRAWRETGREIYVYFDNDVKVRAPFDAMNLAARFGHGTRVPFPLAALRAAEAARRITTPLGTWDRWRRPPHR